MFICPLPCSRHHSQNGSTKPYIDWKATSELFLLIGHVVLLQFWLGVPFNAKHQGIMQMGWLGVPFNAKHQGLIQMGWLGVPFNAKHQGLIQMGWLGAEAVLSVASAFYNSLFSLPFFSVSGSNLSSWWSLEYENLERSLKFRKGWSFKILLPPPPPPPLNKAVGGVQLNHFSKKKIIIYIFHFVGCQLSK